MSVEPHAPRRLLIIALAVPVIALVYVTAVGRRTGLAARSVLATMLGATVIGSVYAEEAWRRAPDGVRRGLESRARVSPAKAATVALLAVALLGVAAPATPASAAKAPEAVIAAAKGYLGTPYRLGREGPNKFDCSGLMYRIFSDAGELPRISGRRLRAVGYLKWFSARGHTSKKNGERGDLVVYGDGSHIGIYLGKDRVISALQRGVSVHGLHEIDTKFTTFLKVQWKVADGTGRSGEVAAATGDRKKDGRKKSRDSEEDRREASSDRTPSEKDPLRGLAVGTMNLRKSHDPDEKIIGWVSRDSKFRIVDSGNSPSGALWYSIEMRNGKAGWVYSRWVDVLDD
jgi:cell wall-associated NlpC family hydrolase